MRAFYVAIAIAALAVPASAQTTQGQAPASKAGQVDSNARQQQSKMQSIARPGPDHILSSDLTGSTLYGAKNENIGEISDVVLDREGRVVAVIVGVGGFLGIGEKSVAIPFQALEIAPATEAQNRTSSQERQRQAQPMPKSSKTAKGTVQPERVVLRGMTRDDLENAPDFDDDDDDNDNNQNRDNRNRSQDNNRKN